MSLQCECCSQCCSQYSVCNVASPGLLGAALALVALSFVDCTNPGAAIAFLCLGVAISGCAYSGFLVNHMDIAPQFAGTLFGLTNCIAAITGFVAPYIASALTTKVQLDTFHLISPLSCRGIWRDY
jgi:ACS family sodium-dependent inorganic phosphate cotransporter-like MFS transporter 5